MTAAGDGLLDLHGKVAVVTGGAVRVGRALSLALAGAGASIVVHYSHSPDEADETVALIRSKGGNAAAIGADFANPVLASRTLFQGAVDRFAHVDVLVNSAAIFAPGTLVATTEVEWDRHFSVNLKAPAFLSREFAARRVPGRPGNIVNITDWRALRPAPGYLAYTLTKSALLTMTRILAQELAPDVRVNAIALGAILPPPGAGDDYMERLAQRVPLKRTGSVDDVTSAALFLLQSEFVTGDVLFVTGGQHLP